MSFRIFVASRSYSKYSDKTRQFLKENDCILEFNEIDRPYKEKDLLEIVAEYDGIIVGVDEVTDQVIKRGKKLKVIAKNGVGVDNIDLKAADEASIFVVNAPGTNSDSVADLALTLMLSLCRSIPLINEMTKEGRWKRKIGTELWEKKVGIIGTGDIGQRVAARLKGFNCQLLAYDINQEQEFARKHNVKYMELDDLLQKADFISLHLPLNKHTRNLIGERELGMMKKTAYLINTSRGGTVDEDALYNALKEGQIAGAACDVFAEEPPGQHKLFELENFIATSHIGAFTYETNERTGMKIARNLVRALKGERPDNVVNNV